MKKGRVKFIGIIAIVLIFVLPKTINYFIYSKAEGVVIKLNEGKFSSFGSTTRSLGGSTSFKFPTIRYIVNDSVLYYDKNNEVLFGVPDLGDKLTVLYNPKNYKDSYLNKIGSFWFALPDLMIFALLCIAWIGVINIIYTKPKKARAHNAEKS